MSKIYYISASNIFRFLDVIQKLGISRRQAVLVPNDKDQRRQRLMAGTVDGFDQLIGYFTGMELVHLLRNTNYRGTPEELIRARWLYQQLSGVDLINAVTGENVYKHPTDALGYFAAKGSNHA